MRFNLFSIRSKLTILTVIVIVFAVSLGVISYYYNGKVLAFSKLTNRIEQLSTGIILLENAGKEFLISCEGDSSFFVTGDCDAVINFNHIAKNNQSLAIYLRRDPLVRKEKALSNKVQDLTLIFKSFNITYNDLILKVWELGYKKYGILQELKLAENKLLAEATVRKDLDLLEEMYSITFMTNEYLATKDSALARTTLKKLMNLFDRIKVRETKPVNGQFISLLLESYTDYLIVVTHKNDNIRKTLDKLARMSGTVESTSKEITQIITSRNELAINRATSSIFFISILMAIVSGLLLVWLSISISSPLQKIQNYIKELVRGKFPEKFSISSRDEIANMANLLKKFIDSLKDKSRFSKEIGEGCMNSEFIPLSDNDELGNALLGMRKSLSTAKKEAELRKFEDDKRNWATQGMAKFGDILRQNYNSIEELSFSIIKNLVQYMEGNQAGLYLYNDDDSSEKFLELTALYAFDRKKFSEKTIPVGEGLLGTCAIEKKTIYMTNIPDNYVRITSGLGQSNPRSLLLVPLKLEEEIFGIVEMASFRQYKPYEIEFVEEVGKSIASTLSNVKVNTRTSMLLKQSQEQSESLASKEEALRASIEAARATQEDAVNMENKLIKQREAYLVAVNLIELVQGGRVQFVNSNMQILLNVNEHWLCGKNYFTDFPVKGKQGNVPDWEAVVSGKCTSFTGFRCFFNVTFLVQESYAVYNDAEDGLKVVCIVHDLTTVVQESVEFAEKPQNTLIRPVSFDQKRNGK